MLMKMLGAVDIVSAIVFLYVTFGGWFDTAKWILIIILLGKGSFSMFG